MKKESKICIIVPVYNIETYIEKCIQSLICQTYRDLQIILVDDGSTDMSGTICDEYAKNDSRIEVIHQKNQGLVSARKAGLSLANGSYIGFVDGDDYVEPDMYENLFQCIKEKGVDIVHSSFYMTDCAIESPKGYIKGDKVSNIKKYVLGLRDECEITPSIWSKLFRSDVIHSCYDAVPNNQSYGEDLLCLTEAMCRGYSIYCLDKAYYHYTIRNDSISHTKSVQNYQREINLYHCLYEIIKNHDLLDELGDSLENYLHEKMLGVVLDLGAFRMNYLRYKCPLVDKIRNKRIILYGAGAIGKDYYAYLSKYQDNQIVAWVDREYEKFSLDYRKIEPINTILEIEYDWLIIAVLEERTAERIRIELIDMGVPNEKIVWEKPVKNKDKACTDAHSMENQ